MANLYKNERNYLFGTELDTKIDVNKTVIFKTKFAPKSLMILGCESLDKLNISATVQGLQKSCHKTQSTHIVEIINFHFPFFSPIFPNKETHLVLMDIQLNQHLPSKKFLLPSIYDYSNYRRHYFAFLGLCWKRNSWFCTFNSNSDTQLPSFGKT